MGNQTTTERKPKTPEKRKEQQQKQQQKQGQETSPGAKASGSAAKSAEPMKAQQISAQINGALPEYAPGATHLSTQLERDKLTQEQLDARTANTGALYSDLIQAWKNAKASEESFVKDFGSLDPIAVQKFADIDAEIYFEGSLASAKKGFYGAVFTSIKTQKTQRSRVYPLMQGAAAGYQRQGKKIPAGKMTGLGTRSHSLWTYYQKLKQSSKSALHDEVLDDFAADAGLPDRAALLAVNPDPLADSLGDPVYEKMKNKLSAGADTLGMVDKRRSMKKDQGTLWFSPEEINISASPDTDFTEIMTMFALQPEWYPDGCLAVTVDTSQIPALGEARKPTAFDGMMSALWVARNQPAQAYGVTGGGAREYVSAGLRWNAAISAVPRIISDSYATQLKALSDRYKSPSYGGKYTGASTSAGEEMLRGNEPVPQTGPAAPAYQKVLGTSGAEASNPTDVKDQAPPPSNSGAGVDGGTMNHATSPAEVKAGRGSWVPPARK